MNPSSPPRRNMGLLVTGTLKKGDPVDVIRGGQALPAVLLEVHTCAGQSDFGDVLRLDMGKSAKANEYAWLILGDGDAATGDVIGKKS
ncbi:MAG: hypothetical protein J5855_05450 [Mailhella sp.]|nr:hypothetical protein [Mailhella sp.]